MTGNLRRHVNTKLVKASSYSAQLVELLQNDASKAAGQDVIEAKAHHASMRGAGSFEKHLWGACLQHYCVSFMIYTALINAQRLTRIEMIRELLSGTIEPNIRYAAHQLKISRTTSIDTIVKRFAKIEKDPGIQSFIEKNTFEKADARSPSDAPLDVPKDIKWRGRNVPIEDASIAQAIAITNAAKLKLSRFLSKKGIKTERQASTYDEVLIAAQDAVDATKTAIDELAAEGIPQHDRRMQALQVTRTAVNYDLVCWRIGRNRVLCGPDDGASSENVDLHRTRKKQIKQDNAEEQEPDGISQAPTLKKETVPRSLRRLRERTVLYDGILQSFESIKELPGVAADGDFVSELAAKRAYFAALRCLAISRGHEMLGQRKNALALVSRAKDMATLAASHQSIRESGQSRREHRAPAFDITSSQASTLLSLLHSLTLRHRAMAELDNLNEGDSSKPSNTQRPLIERLNEWPKSGKVDLGYLVEYPPEIECVPVKPIYLDLAWNYVQYSGEKRSMPDNLANAVPAKEEKKARGWFGFGR